MIFHAPSGRSVEYIRLRRVLLFLKDDALSAAVDETGRQDVIHEAINRGYGQETPPDDVWWEIVKDLRSK